jgi:hypothetical protein
VAPDPLVPKTLLRLRRLDAGAARRAEHALDELLPEGGLADLTQHDLQGYLWFRLPDAADPQPTADALARFFELADMNRYASIASAETTREILQAYRDRGSAAAGRLASRAMDASGVVPPDLPELDWGDVMGTVELDAYNRIAATLELALAAGELRPGQRGWRVTQARLTRQQITMPRSDGGPLLDRICAERLDSWADLGGHRRRDLASAMLSDLVQMPAMPRDLTERTAPVQWLLELAAGRGLDEPGVPLTVTGNLSRRVVQEAADRFGWWEVPGRAPRSETDLWRLTELRTAVQKIGALRRTGRRLILGVRGRTLLDNPEAQWSAAMGALLEPGDFDGAAQEAAMMLLLRAAGMVEVGELVAEVTDVVAGSGWRDVGSGSPPHESDVHHAVWALLRRCQLWSLVELGQGPGWTTQVRLSDPGRRGGYAALRALALRPRRTG